MTHLPGWDSLTATSAIHRFFEIGGIVVLAVLVLFETAAYFYGHHQTFLEEASTHAARQADLKAQQDAFNANLAKLKKDAQKTLEASERQSKQRDEEAEDKIATLKEKQAPRRLTEDQKASIVKVALGHPGQKFSVIYSNSAESDAKQFAKDFDDVLGTKWTRIDPLAFNNFVPSPVSVWVCVSQAYAANPNLTPPSGARPLADALTKLGIYGNNEGKPYTMGNMALDLVWIVIGSRPVTPN